MRDVVVIESPFASSSPLLRKAHRLYAETAMRHALLEGKVPVASHVFYTDALDDTLEDERTLGMEAGFVLGDVSKECWVFVDLGVSEGMLAGARRADERGTPIMLMSMDITYKDLIRAVMLPRTVKTAILSGAVAMVLAAVGQVVLALLAVAAGALFDKITRVHLDLTARGEMARRFHAADQEERLMGDEGGGEFPSDT